MDVESDDELLGLTQEVAPLPLWSTALGVPLRTPICVQPGHIRRHRLGGVCENEEVDIRRMYDVRLTHTQALELYTEFSDAVVGRGGPWCVTKTA